MFLTAEEVPRWFGLSIVLIYLVGLGGVARFGIVQARRAAAGYYEQSSRYAVDTLLDRLAALKSHPLDERQREAVYRLALRDFASNVPTRSLRILDGERRVVASINEAEVGTVLSGVDLTSIPERELEVSLAPVAGESVDGGHDRVYRARIVTSRPSAIFSMLASGPAPTEPLDTTLATGAGDAESVRYIEARLPSEVRAVSTVADHASSLMIVLVVLGALFLVYRCLREQLRGVSRIAERLQARRDQIEEDLAALRISDAQGGTVSAWNELIDVVQDSLAAVQRTEANVELSRVLERSSGGALSEALNAIPDGLLYVTDEVRIEYINSTACRLFSWNGKEVKGATLQHVHAEGLGAGVLNLLHEALQPDGSYGPRTGDAG